MKFEQAQMNPTYAERLLQGNIENNRKVSEDYVRKLSGAMMRGEWRDNGEAIKVDTAGRLVDGQHRLKAVIHSGCTVPMVIVYGVDPESFKTIDIGRSRTMGNLLGIEGHTDGRGLAAAAATVWRYRRATEGGNYSDLSHGTPTPEQVFKVLEEYPKLPEYVAWSKVARRKIGGGPPSILAATLLLCEEVATDVAYVVWDDVAAGANIPLKSPLLLARQACAWKKRLSSSDQGILLCKLLKAWNLWGREEKVQQLVWKPGIERIPVAQKPNEWVNWP